MGARGPKARPVIDRFAAKVAVTDSGCVQWLASTNGVGYGSFRLDPGEGSRRVYAHRWSYEWHVGPIPEGMQLDHLCRNTLCVNPDHLEPVTPAENFIRGFGFAGINAKKVECIKGHPFTPANTYIRPTTGARRCRTCERARDRARKRQNRKAA